MAIDSPLVRLSTGAQIVWIVLSNIVLLNALIAMMNTTYAQVEATQDGQWRLQFLEQVLRSRNTLQPQLTAS